MNWTSEDAERAAKEGWKLVNGIPFRRFDKTGFCPHASTAHLLQFLLAKADSGSEWHRNIVINMPWSEGFNSIAMTDGWVLVICSIDKIPFFRRPLISEYIKKHLNTSDQIMNHIKERADEGSLLHIKALAHFTKLKLTRG